VGEKVAKPDEGVFPVAATLRESRKHDLVISFSQANIVFPSITPLIRLRHLLPPKRPGGRRRSIQENAEFFKGVRNAG
jgi:hypothetical protein